MMLSRLHLQRQLHRPFRSRPVNLVYTYTYRSFSSPPLELLKELRAKSGAPMVECKKALEQSDHDLSQAMDWLRKHGASKAINKVQGREATEGMVGLMVSSCNQKAALTKVASETDFASRSEAFSSLVKSVTQATLEASPSNHADTDTNVDAHAHALVEAEADVLETVVNDQSAALQEAIVAIRENLQVVSATHYHVAEGMLVGYLHGRVSDTTGTSAALVHVLPKNDQQPVQNQVLQDVGKKLAMHIVAARPSYLTPDSIPPEVLEREQAILLETMPQNKPPEILDKILNGKLQKFYQQVCLLNQSHMIEEDNPSVRKVLDKAGLKAELFALRS